MMSGMGSGMGLAMGLGMGLVVLIGLAVLALILVAIVWLIQDLRRRSSPRGPTADRRSEPQPEPSGGPSDRTVPRTAADP